MSLDIVDALSDGFDRTFQRNGLILIAGFVLLGFLDNIGSDTFSRGSQDLVTDLVPGEMPGMTQFAGASDMATPWAIPVGFGEAVVLAIVIAVIAEALRIISIRVILSDNTDSIPSELLSHQIGLATLNGVIGGIVVLVLVGIGLILLIIPGIFLAISFFFVRQEIALEDNNFVDAMSNSWSLSAGNRIELFALIVIVVILGVIASVIGGMIGLIGPTVSRLITVLIGAITTVFGIAVTTQAYDQLRTDQLAESTEPTPNE